VIIAVDARELCGHRTGVGRYLGALLHEWTTDPTAARHTWRLYAHDTPVVPEAFRHAVHVVPGAGGTQWEQWHLARAVAADAPAVLFSPAYTMPCLVRCPRVVTIHDMSFAAHPEWFGWREGGRRRVLTRWSARHADRVLTISEFSRREILRWTGCAKDRVVVTPLGVPTIDASGPHGTAVAGDAASILYVGSIFARRHVDALIAAFLRHVAPQHPTATLDIIGDNRMPAGVPLCAELDTAPPPVRARVRIRSFVDDVTLQQAYASASVFAFLSDYEGFGLTPLEAMAHGVVPVVLDTDISREVYGAAARRVAPGERLVPDLGAALLDLLTSEGSRRALRHEASRTLARYRWSHTAAATLRVLEEVARVA
jgi:glycosyltransferase involved in cell wall biosynthesis